MTKKTTVPVKKAPTLKKRQAEFVKRVNKLGDEKLGDELGIAVVAKLSYTEDGIVPKLYLADVLKKPKEK